MIAPPAKPDFLSYLRHSFAFRLAVVYVAMFMGSFGLLIGFLYWMVVARPGDEVLKMVRSESSALALVYTAEGHEKLVEILQRRQEAPAVRKAFHVFIDRDGRFVSGNVPSWPSKPGKLPFEIEADRYQEGNEMDYQALSLDHVFPDGARLIVGRDIEDIAARREWLLDSLLWVTFAAVMLGGIVGVFMSMAVGRRIETIYVAARQVIGGDLSGRIALSGAGDDLDRLAETLNMMLTRIEASVESISRVSDSVAHELRLSLSRLHAELEDLATAAERGQPLGDTIERAIVESDRLKSVFESLLRIARIETGRHTLDHADVDLVRLACDALDLYQPEAEGHGLRLECRMPGTPMMTTGDPNLLFQTLTNLLDNAIKFAPPDSRVRLDLDRVNGMLQVSVENEGPGIPPEHRARVTERFYRAGKEQAPGLGLGLSLVHATLDAHGGRLDFVDRKDGFAVVVTLPAAVPHPPAEA